MTKARVVPFWWSLRRLILSKYYAEILRAEGLNAFTVTDISPVLAATLATYDVVLVGEMPLTSAQLTVFSNYVTSGGNLIAMRPDKQLAGLLGLVQGALVERGISKECFIVRVFLEY